MSWDLVKGYLAEAGSPASSADVECWMQRIAANPGKAGESYLMQAMNCIDMRISCLTKAVLLLAMSPFITYGVGADTVPTLDTLPNNDQGASWDEQTIGLLVDLSARRLTGHNARDAVIGELNRLGENSRSLLYRVLVKEMRIGCGPKTVNKFHKGLIPIFEHKGAKRTKEELPRFDWTDGSWAEFKYDGWRGVIKVAGGEATSFSRNGLPMDNLNYRAEDLLSLTQLLIKHGVLEDRAWAWDGEGKAMGHFNNTSSEARKAGKGADLTYIIFDLIPWEHMSGGTEPIEVRYARLDRVMAFIQQQMVQDAFSMLRLADRFEIDNEADAWELYDIAREQGHEGLILKKKRSLYTPGKTPDWVKVKPEETKDLVVKGTYQGQPGSRLHGRLAGVIVDNAGVDVRVAILVEKDRDTWEKDTSLIVGQVVEVLYHEETPDGSLREPRLAKNPIRKDKYPEDADGRKDGGNE